MSNAVRLTEYTGKETARKWYVVNTKPRKEEFVRRQLELKNIRAFCPLISDYRCTNTGMTPVLKPLFPGYLFVSIALDIDYYKVRWLPGVKKLMGSGEQPVPLDDGVVDFLMERADENSVIKRKTFRKGDTVRVRRGPFKGLVGIIEKDTSPHERVKVLLNLIKYQATVELPGAMLERG